MNPIAHLAIASTADAKVTPLEVLADFADATRGWVYMERESRHYADEKDAPGLVLRHWQDEVPSHVDFAFAADPAEPNTVHLVILDAPDVEDPLADEDRIRLLNTLEEALRGYLDTRPDHATLHVDRERLGPAAS